LNPCYARFAGFDTTEEFMASGQLAFDDLCYYTLSHGDPSFIHQHVVDAFAAQSSTGHDKPIRLTFALVGLYLHVEEGFSGRQVQLAHMRLAQKKRQWPAFTLPHNRGAITVTDVIAVAEGAERDRMIHEWCASVWDAFRGNREIVMNLVRDIPPSAPRRAT